MLKQLTTILLSLAFLSALGQKYTISGYVEDGESGEKLIGASIYDSTSLKGTSSNIYGFFSLTLPEGTYDIVVSYVGYGSSAQRIELKEDIKLDFKVKPVISLETFEVVSNKQEAVQKRTEMSVNEITMKEVKTIPVIFGERDILKTLQLLPGVQSGAEGSSGLYVRGGGPDQNLILLDGVPVYNASHLFGFFSVFNADAISQVKLIKGGFPARYGGRLSSVIDIRMKEGNNKKFHGEGSIGLISSKLTLEGPIIKDRTSFIISGRRTYIDLLARPLIKRTSERQGTPLDAGYFFYDLNAKVNHKVNDKNRLFLSAYLGNDRGFADFSDSYSYDGETGTTSYQNGLRWGNITTALRWNSNISKKLFANTTLTYSEYEFDLHTAVAETTETADTTTSGAFELGYVSGINDVAAKVDFDFIPNPSNYIKFGASSIYHTFIPGVTALEIGESGDAIIDTSFGESKIFAHEYEMYIEDDARLGSRIKVNAGLHYSGFLVRKKHFPALQPRISGRFLINDELSVKASYARMAQFIHLLTNATIGLPTDLWVPATDSVLPEASNQIALGLAYGGLKDFEISIEGYYKTMTNLIEYKEGASFFDVGGSWESKVASGNGRSYGCEVLVRKRYGKLTGWLGYTLSWTYRKFENLNFGDEFPFRYDRRHDAALVLSYELSDRVDFGLTWVYGTGNAVTLPVSKYSSAPTVIPFTGESFSNPINYYKSRNGFRMAPYHRLDLGVNLRKQKKRFEHTWSFGVYNTYNRRNPFFLFFDYDNRGNRVLKQLSLFPLIPSVAYSFKF